MWDNCTQYQANELEEIQHDAARIVTGTTKYVIQSKVVINQGGGEVNNNISKDHILTITLLGLLYS